MALALLGSRHASGQVVRGLVTDSTTAGPVAGAVVSLVDAAGKPLARTLSDQGGRFRIAAGAGAARAQVLRIGYRPRDLRLPPPSEDEIVLDVRMAPIAKILAAVQVIGTGGCAGGGGGTDALGLWEQARAGLLATVVAREERPARVRNLVFERQVDAHNGKVLSQNVKKHTGTSTRPFAASRPAADFAARGYIAEDNTGRTYSAPDADVLLDTTFLATHCFSVRADAEHAGQVGLGFQPAASRDTLVDVTGTLWLDRDTPALRALEFRYTSLEPAGIEARAGGSLTFRAMPNGVVFIERWLLSLPMYVQRASAGYRVPPPRRERRNLTVDRIVENGGELAFAEWPDARWRAVLGKVEGHVAERGTHRPIANARAWLENGDDVTTTDAKGDFVLDDLLPGAYSLKVTDTTLSNFGVTQSKQVQVVVTRDAPAVVTLEWQPLSELLRDRCHGQETEPGSVPLVGRVFLPGGTPADGAVAAAAWQKALVVNPDVATFRQLDRQTNVDAEGRFYLCGVPLDHAVRLRAVWQNSLMKDTSVVIPRDAAYGVVTLFLTQVARRP